MPRSYYNNESDIKKIFEEDPCCEISVKKLVRRITELHEYNDKFWNRYNSICRTIRKLETGKNPYLDTKIFTLHGVRDFDGLAILPTKFKMVRLWKVWKKRTWKIEYDKDEFVSQLL